jgi:hypothetical protein
MKSLRVPIVGGRLLYVPGPGEAELEGSAVFATNLRAALIRGGELVREYELGDGVVTHAGVRLLSQDTAISAGAATLNVMKYHGSGTGTTAATATDTALQAAIGTTATAGTNSNADASPNATVTSVGTISYSGSYTVTEWGLFNSGTLSGATMFDHRVFSAINVVSGDSIQFTWTLTLNSGG